MWTDAQAQGALSAFKHIGSFIVASRQAKADRAWQAYNNAMTRLQNAQNQNNITINENLLVERQIRESFNIDKSKYKTSAEVTVAAAAVGAEGNSVDLVLQEVSKNASNAQATLARDFETQALVLSQQREASNLQTEMQIDYTQIPKPNILRGLLDWGADFSTQLWGNKRL